MSCPVCGGTGYIDVPKKYKCYKCNHPKTKEVESVEINDLKSGDKILNMRVGKFHGNTGVVEYVNSHLVVIKDESGEIYKIGKAWFPTELIKLQKPNEVQSYSPIQPTHYHEGGIDVFKYAEVNFSKEKLEGYHQISAIKYISRAGKKDGNPFEQDIAKAKVHLEELEKLGVEL